jgi:nickel-dependent lactate racemase
LVSGLPVETVTNMGFIAASSPQEAWEQAKKLVGDHATATIIPDGVAVIPRRKKNG